MACEWEEYQTKLSALGYDTYDNETLIAQRVEAVSQLTALNTVIALIEIGVGVGCVACNVVVLRYYISRVQSLVPLLYTALLSADLVAGVGCVVSGATLLLLTYCSSYAVFWWVAPLNYLLSSLPSHTSVFYNTVLASVRTLMITHPHFKISVGTSQLLYSVY